MMDSENPSELPTGPAEPLARAEIGLVMVSLVVGILLLVVLALTLPTFPSNAKPAQKASVSTPK